MKKTQLPEVISGEQKKFIENFLYGARYTYAFQNAARKKYPKFSSVRNAEKIIAAHKKKIDRESNRLSAKHDKLKSDLREKLVFGTKQQVLAAFKKYQDFLKAFDR